jgi:uncharacterized delta-60 repeat protein/uncharacterized repeat protein (TIGR01451 family)
VSARAWRLGRAGLVLHLLALTTLAQAADLDPGFGTAGRVTSDLGPGSNSARAVIVQPDGKILAAGSSGSSDFALVRYNSDGTPDGSFGAGGRVVTSVGNQDSAFDLALQVDGKIVAVGSTAPMGFCCQFAIVRWDSNGDLDPGFGTGGIVTTAFGGLTEATAVAVQPDGKIVVAGAVHNPVGASGFALARYLSNGTLDPAFGSGGKVVTAFAGGYARGEDLAIEPSGRIVVVGSGGSGSDFALAAYQASGSLDTTFGSGGQVLTDFGGNDWAASVVIQEDGKLVVAGCGKERFAVARYDANGTLDTSFDGDGTLTTTFTGDNIESAEAVALAEDGRLLVVGSAFSGFKQVIAAARYRSDGSLDVSFGQLGLTTTEFPDYAAAYAVALQPDAKAVVAGGGGPCTPGCGFVLARYLRLPSVDLQVTKTDGVAQRIAGQSTTYTIVVTNNEPHAVVAASLVDALPPAVASASWTCAATGGGSCTASGTGGIDDALTLLIGSTATYTLGATLDPGASGMLTNTAVLTPPAGQTDLVPANNAATDTDTLVPAGDLAITISDGVSRIRAGEPVTYTIVASNAGPNPVSAATVSDVLPASLTGASWTCAGSGGGSCAASGTGDIAADVALPVGGSVTYTLTAAVSASATGTVTHVATVAVKPGAGVGDPYPANDTARDEDVLAGDDFYTLAPCRVVDTRDLGAPIGGPALAAGANRVFQLSGKCGIPALARAVSANVTVASPAAQGNLRAYPTGSPEPSTSVINYLPSVNRANNAVLGLGAGGGLTVRCNQASGTVHLVLDVNGYFLEGP